MKVLHLISGGDKGGAKTHVFTLLSALQEEIFIRVICFMEGVFYQEIKETNIPSMLIKQKYRNDLTIISKLVAHIREEQYSLIHAHGARANFIALIIRPYIKIPMITTVHSDYRLDFTQNIYKKMVFTELNRKALAFMDYYIAVSNQFKEMLIERNFKEDKIYTVYNSIDFDEKTTFLDKQTFLKKYNIDCKGKTIVGIIGRFDKVKGHDVFMKAAINILKKRSDVIFLLAGEGPEQNNLQNMAKNAGLLDNFKFLGFVNDVFSFVNAIDINVLSSYSESFPYVLLEGAKMDKPTVSTAVGGIPDLIKEGFTGLLAEKANDASLAEKIMTLIDDKAYAEELGKNLGVFARTNFSKESMKNRHLEIYEDVLKRAKEENKLYDVCLSGYYGFKNSGDDALLKAIVDGLRKEKPDIKIVVLSKDPKETSERHNVYSISRSNFVSINKVLKRCRLFLNGGGSLIQDITSTRSLYYYTYLMYLAKKHGLKIMLYANGIGPIIKKHNISIAQKALKLCDVITLREKESLNELKKLELDYKDIVFSCDPTFSLKPSSEEKIKEIFSKENLDFNKKYVAVSIRQWKYNDINFSEKFAEALNGLCEKYSLTPLFIPMQQPFDTIISKEVISKLKVDAYILNGEYSAMDLLGIISKCHLVMAMRLHTLIYAVSVAVPIVGIVYDPKIKAFMDDIDTKTYIKCENIDKELLISVTENIMDNYISCKEDVETKSKKLKELSNKDSNIAINLI